MININLKFKPTTYKYPYKGRINIINAAYSILYKCSKSNTGQSYGKMGNCKYNNVMLDVIHGHMVLYNTTRYKRGKYKDNKYIEVNVYKLPLALITELNVEITQNRKNFTIKFND